MDIAERIKKRMKNYGYETMEEMIAAMEQQDDVDIKELKENPDYKDAFIVEKPDNDPEQNIGTDGPVEPPINAPYFAGPTRSEQEPSKDNVFNFGFTGVRKHD